MKVIKIKGGLGNQMFQYAYGRNLEKRGEKIVFDISFFYGNRNEKDTARDFKLDQFALRTQADFSQASHPGRELFDKIKRRWGFKMSLDYPSEKYFLEVASDIREEFVIKNGLGTVAREILQKINNSNSVSLHVRRGDYVQDKKTGEYHGVCDLTYYNKAIQIIKEKVTDPTFFVFSDDISWVRENFKGENFLFVSSKNISDVEDLMLMSACKHQIIANSSFSWWGAWLNKNLQKIVVAPKKWLAVNKKGIEEIIPISWIKI